MNIDDYIEHLGSSIRACPIIASYDLGIDRKTEEIVFISGRIDFRDGSILDFKEFVESTDMGTRNISMPIIFAKVQNFFSDMIMRLIQEQEH